MYDATQLFEPVQLTEEEKLARFKERIEQGEKIEADDWMPDFYRDTLIKLISMHGISEIMGALPEKEWVPKAPSLRRKLGIMAKVQDEMGHGQLLLRVVEDLMKPYGKTRGDLMDDLFTGRLKFHNVFHMPTRSWADAGMIGWLVDGAAIVNQVALCRTSYGPYARAMVRICKEESFHQRQGFEAMMALANGTPEQKQMAQDAVNRFWWPALMMFGPSDEHSPNSAQSMAWKIKRFSNDELRQKFVDNTVPQVLQLGLEVPDPDLKFNEETGHYEFGEIDWHEFNEVIAGRGPCNHERIEARRKAWENGKWVRDAAVVYAKKQQLEAKKVA